MREAKLRVEQTTFNNGTTAYYGNVITKKVVEDYHIAEFDKRKDIAPCGLCATISIDRSDGFIVLPNGACVNDNKINSKDVLDIKISASYFEYDDENCYTAFFHIEDKVYEVCIWCKKNKISDITLSEWYEVGDFEDGDDADKVYHAKDFINFEEYYT